MKKLFVTREIADPKLRTAGDAAGLTGCILAFWNLVSMYMQDHDYWDIKCYIAGAITALADLFGIGVSVARIIHDIRELRSGK